MKIKLNFKDNFSKNKFIIYKNRDRHERDITDILTIQKEASSVNKIYYVNNYLNKFYHTNKNIVIRAKKIGAVLFVSYICHKSSSYRKTVSIQLFEL